MGVSFPIFSIIGILVLLALSGLIPLGIFLIIRSIRRRRSRNVKVSKAWCILTVLCIVVVAVSWIFNIGWYRVILTWSLLPVVHAILFAVLGFIAARRVSYSKKLKALMIFCASTYLSAYLLLPDGGDYGGMYFFFGLVRNNALATVMMYVAFACFVANIVFMILTCVEMRRCKRKLDWDEGEPLS
jgi:hypothetical protein